MNSSTISLVKSGNVSQPLERDGISFLSILFILAVTISLVGEDVVELNESSNTLSLQLRVSGFSFGDIPLHVIPVSYSQFEGLSRTLGLDLSLSDIVGGRAIPLVSALPGRRTRPNTIV